MAGQTYGALDGQAFSGGADLFVAKYNGTGVKFWTRQLGTALEDGATAVATDQANNFFVAGYTIGALDGQTSAGGCDLLVAKYLPNGLQR